MQSQTEPGCERKPGRVWPATQTARPPPNQLPRRPCPVHYLYSSAVSPIIPSRSRLHNRQPPIISIPLCALAHTRCTSPRHRPIPKTTSRRHHRLPPANRRLPPIASPSCQFRLGRAVLSNRRPPCQAQVCPCSALYTVPSAARLVMTLGHSSMRPYHASLQQPSCQLPPTCINPRPGLVDLLDQSLTHPTRPQFATLANKRPRHLLSNSHFALSGYPRMSGSAGNPEERSSSPRSRVLLPHIGPTRCRNGRPGDYVGPASATLTSS
ncbi:hypothetical protein BKA93DRAFT_451141 [Sparassis latifolia]